MNPSPYTPIGFLDRLRNSPELSDAAFRVAVVLSGYADKAGVCWPSQGFVAIRLAWGLTKTKEAFHDLQEAGVIEYRVRSQHRGERSIIQLRTGADMRTGSQERTASKGETGSESRPELVRDRDPRTYPLNSPKEKSSCNELLDMTPDEGRLLDLLRDIPSWPLKSAEDLQFLRGLAQDFPRLDLEAELRGFRANVLDRPIKPKGQPHTRLHTWCRKAVEFGREVKNDIQEGDHNGRSREHRDHRREADKGRSADGEF